MIKERIEVIYLGEDISEKVKSAELRPEAKILITGKYASIDASKREIVLRLSDGSVIETDTDNCKVRVTKGQK